MNRKLTIEFVKAQFKKEGHILLSQKYVNSGQKLDYICPNGHRHSMTWNHWHEGHRCPKCLSVKNSERFRLDFNIVKDSFTENGYILLTDHYINAHQQLEYICPEGHKHLMTWNNWNKGYRCPSCFSINFSGSGHPNWKGGISCEPYCDVWINKDFKESIKERDNYTCQNPDCWGKGGRAGRLTIHHIDYVKKNCSPSNLITLCTSCNSRANYNRKYHKEFYKNIMKRESTVCQN